MTIHVLDDPTFVEIHWNKFVGYPETPIVLENFIAGLKLLRMAHDKGMITLFDAEKYAKIGCEILKTDKRYPDFYKGKVAGAGEVTINPDLVGVTLESLLGVQADVGAVPIFGDLDFLRYMEWRRPTGTLLSQTGVIHVDHGLELLLESPQASNLEELFFFATNKEFVRNVSEKLRLARQKKTTTKDVTIMGIEFGATLTIDAAVFSGDPPPDGTSWTIPKL